LEEKYNLSFDISSIRFHEDSFTAKIECRINASNERESTMAIDFRKLAGTYGLKAESLYKIFVLRDHVYKIVGLKPRNRKYPIICKDIATGKNFKFDPITVIRCLDGE